MEENQTENNQNKAPQVLEEPNNTLSAQAVRSKKLRPYFEKGYSPETVVSMLKRQIPVYEIDISTVRNYFRRWAREIREHYSEDIFARSEEVRGRAITAYEDLLIQTQDSLNLVNGKIQRAKEEAQNKATVEKGQPEPAVSNGLLELRDRLLGRLESILEKKFSVETQETLSEKTRKQVENFVRKERERLNLDQ